jgi:hypothetical protein
MNIIILPLMVWNQQVDLQNLASPARIEDLIKSRNELNYSDSIRYSIRIINAWKRRSQEQRSL